MPIQKPETPEITLSLVNKLIAEQFPQWAHLPISPVELSGWDNRTFLLGQTMLIRLPSAQMYAAKVEIEQNWLPILAPNLPFEIPKPIAMGKPSKLYPWNWSIYNWIDGKSANLISLDEADLNLLAEDLTKFLKALHKIDTVDAPKPGPHNFYRGDSPLVYDEETRSALAQLQDFIDIDTAKEVWQKAISSKWSKKPIWIHGDLSAGNILLKDKRLVGIIDWGGMAVGDPACDLVIAWTLLKNESRKFFKQKLNLDPDTWARARGWVLWKALITLAKFKDKFGSEAIKQQQIVEEILKEHQFEN